MSSVLLLLMLLGELFHNLGEAAQNTLPMKSPLT